MKYLIICILSLVITGNYKSELGCRAELYYTESKVDSLNITIPLKYFNSKIIDPHHILISIPPNLMWVDLKVDSTIILKKFRLSENNLDLVFISDSIALDSISSIELWMMYRDTNHNTNKFGPVFIICDECEYSERMLSMGGAILSKQLSLVRNVKSNTDPD